MEGDNDNLRSCRPIRYWGKAHLPITGAYPEDWDKIARRVKDEAGWKCVRCGHPHDRATGHVLTVHHLSGDKSLTFWYLLLALCQRCHLHIQSKLNPNTPWPFEHSEWFKPYVAGFYAWKYLGLELTRHEAIDRMAELLALDLRALGVEVLT